MIRALLLGAFATSALGVKCGVDISAVACRDFTSTSDFNVANVANSAADVVMTGQIQVNGATQYIGDGPWDRTKAALSDQPNGCTYSDSSSAGDFTDVVATHASAGWTCDSGSTGAHTACTGATDTAEATRSFSVGTTLTAMVASLDNAGRFAVYFQRVLANPIQVASTATSLKWIAENACKVYVDVEFECTGPNCVEVTTIVCASFAGININNKGVVAIECKVPAGFGISSVVPTATAGPNGGAQLTVSGVNNQLTFPAVDADVWAGTQATIVGGTMSYTASGLTGVLTGEVTTAKALAQNERFAGSVDVKAWVEQSGVWSLTKQDLHEAKYNLTRASNVEKTFTMPINVLFYSDVSLTLLTSDTAIKNLFSDAATQRPFLARTNVEYGIITQHEHAYLSVIAKVDTPGNVNFLGLEVYTVTHTVQGAANPTPIPASGNGFCSTVGLTSWYTATGVATNWPQMVMSCTGLMNGANNNHALMTNSVTAGDTLNMGLKWKLAGPAVSTGAGKAALLQDAADEVQSVEVSLTIQLGGGETTITTAGGSDGSADPTVTYIIIAVCIVAAGLILAVVVVAFMCMRNRSQEAIVSMSPQKCTVAAVYDISQPKKADAMDV